MKQSPILPILLMALVFTSAQAMEPQTRVWSMEWLDRVDEPTATAGTLSLPAAGSGNGFNSASAAGNVTVLVEINPKLGWWSQELAFGKTTCRLDHAPALKEYQVLTKEYAGKPGVQFVSVWTGPAGEAAAYAAEHDVPGLFVLDRDGALIRFTGMHYEDEDYKQTVRFTYGFNVGEPFRTASCILDAQGRIMYRDRRFFSAANLRVIIDRLLDPAFDRDIRMDFPAQRNTWSAEDTPEGLVYTEDFEQYNTSYAFKLDPDWGFSYDYQGFMDYRGDIRDGRGREDSRALYVNVNQHWLNTLKPHYYQRDDFWFSIPTLTFPAPLIEGSLSFYVKKGPPDPLAAHRNINLMKNNILPNAVHIVAGIAFYTSHNGMFLANHGQDHFMGDGAMLNNELFSGRVANWNGTFRGVGPKDSSLTVGDGWHFVEVRCVPDEFAKLFVDGQEIGIFESSSITTIAFSPLFHRSGYYVDDVQITYHGEALALRTAHAKTGPWPRQHDQPRDELDNDKILMTRIPAGVIDQGNPDHATQTVTLYANTLPYRKGVKVNSFHISTWPVSEGQFAEVYNWAEANGYRMAYGRNSGSWRYFSGIRSPATHNPDIFVAKTKPMVIYKWCNALSEKEGLTPCYYTDPTHKEVFRSGGVDLTPAHVKWDADGYRLPTVAEWQRAYMADSGYTYNWWGDDMPYDTWNPKTTAITAVKNWGRFHRGEPGTIPPNPFGLPDMGYYYEHCFDVSAPWDASNKDNPKGPRIEDGNESQAYLERCAVLYLKHEIRRGGKTDNEFSKRANRALMGAHHETYGHPGSVHKRADHPPEHVTPDSMFHVVQSDLENNPDGSYAAGRPTDVTGTWKPPVMNSVRVHAGEDWKPGMIDLRKLPGGSFRMGGNRTKPSAFMMLYMNETPVRTVKVGPFAMGKTEVTFDQYKKVHAWAQQQGYTFNPFENWKMQYLMKGDGPDNTDIQATGRDPVNHVNWYDAVKWCNALSEMEDRTPCYYTDASHETVYREGELDLAPDYVDWLADGYRLPTEAEWEYAARAGTDTVYFWGDGPDGDYFWYYLEMYHSASHSTKCYYPVGQKKPNAFGLHDMVGNVFEWCFDWLGPYDAAETDNPRGCSKETCVSLHGKLAEQRYAEFGTPERYLDPDPFIGEFQDKKLRDRMMAYRGSTKRLRYSGKKAVPPEGMQYDRSRRVQRGGNDWPCAKRFGAPPGWPRHDQGFRVVISGK